jgi:hypothetical protein
VEVGDNRPKQNKTRVTISPCESNKLIPRKVVILEKLLFVQNTSVFLAVTKRKAVDILTDVSDE